MNIKWILFLCLLPNILQRQTKYMKRSKISSLSGSRYYGDLCIDAATQNMENAMRHFFKEDISRAGGIDSFKFECSIEVLVNHDLKQGKIYSIKTTSKDSGRLCENYDWEGLDLYIVKKHNQRNDTMVVNLTNVMERTFFLNIKFKKGLYTFSLNDNYKGETIDQKQLKKIKNKIN